MKALSWHATRRGASALALAAALAAGAGCESPPDLSPAPGYDDPYPAAVNDPQIAVLAPDLRPWLGFHDVLVIDDGTGPLQVEVPVRNLSDRRLMIDYRITFTDAAGREVTPGMGWEMSPLYPKQTVRLKRSALDQRAVDWKLEVKWAK